MAQRTSDVTSSGVKEQLLPSATQADDLNEATDDEQQVPLWRRPYRRLALLTVFVDIATTAAIAVTHDDLRAIDFQNYAFISSSSDVLFLGVLRAVVLTACLTSMQSVRAAKAGGYTALLCLLSILVKTCASDGGRGLYMALLVSSLAYCGLEALLLLLVSIFSCEAADRGAAPTQQQAFESLRHPHPHRYPA